MGTLPAPPLQIDVPGQSPDRVLVLSGVHGSEQCAVEVAELIAHDLARRPSPHNSVTIVPELFAGNVHREARRTAQVMGRASQSPREIRDSNWARYSPEAEREVPSGSMPNAAEEPNRQFPPLGECAPGTLTRFDALSRPIEAENEFLIDLIGDTKPIRIITLHGKRMRPRPPRYDHALPGIFVDPVTDLPVRLTRRHPRSQPPVGDDDALALEVAAYLDRVWYRETQAGRLLSRYGDDRDHWVPGNWLHSSGNTPTARFPNPNTRDEESEPGHSLGEWGPREVTDSACGARRREGIPIFTVEIRRYYRSQAFLPLLAPANRRITTEQRAALTLEYQERRLEMQTWAQALREVLIEAPA